MKVKCQYTGIEFEAASARTKNHPLVSKLLAEAAKNSTYNLALSRLEEAKAAGMDDIDAVIAFVKSGIRETQKERAAERAQVEQERQQTWQRVQSAHQERNRILKEHGYTWQKDTQGGDLTDEEADWILVSPDGRIVTEGRALDEIRRGADVVQAEERAREQAAEERRAAIAAEEAGLIERMQARGLKQQYDWSWDDFRYSTGEILEETDNFEARQYLCGSELLGFVVSRKDRK